jgi:hypothetical protein
VPSDKPNTLKSLQADLERLAHTVADLAKRLGALEAFTPDARRLSRDELAKVTSTNPFADFEVIAHWAKGGKVFQAGQMVRADLYPHLADYVQAGLALAIPLNTTTRVEVAQRLADAQREVAQAEVDAARAVLARQAIEDATSTLDSMA